MLIRIFIAAFGCTAVIWGLMTLPTFWRQSTLERTAQRIINGEPFKAGALAGELPIIETVEKIGILRSGGAAECGNHPASHRRGGPVGGSQGKIRCANECGDELNPRVTLLLPG